LIFIAAVSCFEMGGMLRCAGRSSPPETERDKPGPYRALSMTLLLLKCKEINVSEKKSYIHPSFLAEALVNAEWVQAHL
jgi:hypothetical protein